jgi:hypothetical protein
MLSFNLLNVFLLLFTTTFCFGLGTRILEQEVIDLAKSLGEWQAHSGYSTYAVRSSVEIKMFLGGFSSMYPFVDFFIPKILISTVTLMQNSKSNSSNNSSIQQ